LIFKAFAREWLVLPDRIELSTSPLPMECSTAGLTPVRDIGMTFIFRVTESIRELPNEADSATSGFLTVTDLNDFNGPAQTTNLGVRSSNLFGRAIVHHSTL
jgi:hypothetical protein